MPLTTLKPLPRAARWLIAGIALALGVVAASCIADWLEERSVERVARWNEAPRGRRLDAPRERTPLCGPVMPGNAWDDYIPAHRKLIELDEHKSLWWRDRPPGVPMTSAAEVVERASDALKLLHQGARRSTARRPADASIQPPWRATEALGAEGAMRLASGDLDGAIEIWATTIQFELDRSVGFSDTAVDLVFELLLDRRLTKPQAVRIASLAEAAEAQVPRASDLLEDRLAGSLQYEIELARLERFVTPGDWLARWGLPSTHRSEVRRLRKENEALLALASEIETGVLSASLARVQFEGWGECERIVRQMRAELRLVKAAALVRQGKDEQVAEWPCDPCDLRPLSAEAAPGRQTRISTRPMDHLWHYHGDCDPGDKISNSSLEITVPR